MSFSKLTSKAKIKIMKESQEPEPVDEPGTNVFMWSMIDIVFGKRHRWKCI